MILGAGTSPASDGGFGASPLLFPPAVFFPTRPALLLGKPPNPVVAGAFDRFGAVTVPLSPPAAKEAVGDPALTTLLAFFAAFLQADGGATAAWNAAGIAPTLPIVRTTHATNPAKTAHVFRTNDLPALYLWRNREPSKFERIADCWHEETSTLVLLWIAPLVKAAIATVRDTILNGIGKALYVATERGRTPGFVVAGDTDRYASRLGSQIYDWIGAVRFQMNGWKEAEIRIVDSVGSGGEYYSALEATFTLVEKLDYSLERYAPLLGTQITETAPDGTVLYVGRAPGPTPPSFVAPTPQPLTYFGTGAPGSTGAAFILGLGSHASPSRPDTFTANAAIGSGLKVYYAARTSLGTATFTVGGFSGGFARTQTGVTVTDASGVSDLFDLYESDYVDVGLVSVTVT